MSGPGRPPFHKGGSHEYGANDPGTRFRARRAGQYSQMSRAEPVHIARMGKISCDRDRGLENQLSYNYMPPVCNQCVICASFRGNTVAICPFATKLDQFDTRRAPKLTHSRCFCASPLLGKTKGGLKLSIVGGCQEWVNEDYATACVRNCSTNARF